MNDKRWKWLVFGLVVLITFFVYFQTTAPTVVFWDVGEFLAASHILGIPHPPGTPLYVIVCKFLDMLPLPLAALYGLINGVPAGDSVLRMTLVAIATGALTVGLVYLIIYDVVSLWKPKTPQHMLLVSAAFGAFLAAFGAVKWMNSIEAETYAPANFFALLAVYLTLLWYRRRDWDASALRFLIAGVYLLVLSSGIHLTSLFALPAMFVFVAVVEPKIIFGNEFWGLVGGLVVLAGLMKQTYEPSTGGAAFLTVGVILMVFYFYRAKFFKDFTDIWTIIFSLGALATLFGAFAGHTFALVAGVFGAVFGMYMRAKLWKDWRGIILILMVLAFSVEFWLIVRAQYIHNHPTVAWINEADPYNWKAFMDVLFRKQYEPAKMLPRRIDPVTQWKVFWMYLNWQYVIVIPLVFLALVGVVTHWSNDKKVFWLVGLVLILATVGFWFAFNLKDSPTHPIGGVNTMTGAPNLPTEVRDRDYFYATAHIMLSLYAGIGLWEILRLGLRYLKRWWAVALLLYPSAAFAVGYQFVKVYPICDRSRFYLAEDSAYNLLISPSTGGVMFTNGDNDTFPVWFDQEVLGVRKDLIIANLSLLNTNWYIRQLKAWGAPISFSNEDIDRLPPITPTRDRRKQFMYLRDFMIRDMIATSAGYKPKETVRIRALDGGALDVPAIYLADPVSFMNDVFHGKSFKTNIYFAMTTTPESWDGWGDHLLMEGMAFRLVPYSVPNGYPLENVQEDYTRQLLHDDEGPVEYLRNHWGYHEELPSKVFRYRGVLDPRVKKTDRYDTNEKIIRNYAQVTFSLGNYYAKNNQLDRAAQELELGKLLLDQIPTAESPGIENQKFYIELSLSEIYTQLKDFQKAQEHIKQAGSIKPGPQVDMRQAELLRAQGKLDEAEKYYQRVLDSGVQDPVGFGMIASFYEQRGNFPRAASLYQKALSGGWRDTSVVNGLARVLRAQGRGQEADSILAQFPGETLKNTEKQGGK